MGCFPASKKYKWRFGRALVVTWQTVQSLSPRVAKIDEQES